MTQKKTLRVGLNATCFNDRPSGAKQRFTGIYGALINSMPNAEFIIYEPVDCSMDSWFGSASNISFRKTPIPSQGLLGKSLNGLKYWRNEIPKKRFDVFERFNLPTLKVSTNHMLMTIHDIRQIYPEYGRLQSMAYKAYIGKSLKAADHVVTVSETMKAEIHSFYPGIPISVIYNGIDSHKFDNISQAELLETRNKYNLPKNFILAVGHLEKRKNYLNLIQAIARLQAQGTACSLVIIGNDSGEGRAIKNKIMSQNISGSVKILSNLNDLEVRSAYKLCNLFIFPSSYEGFGIPILEAMAAKRPMVLSDIPVFRELTQNQGIYFPHNNIEAMTLAINNVLSSKSEQERLVEYGTERVLEFSFLKLAEKLRILYQVSSI